jgi:hypothetical protein
LGDLVHQLFEAAMFLSPLFDLREQFDGDISGVSFGFDFPGQIMTGMFMAPGTTASGITTGPADGHQAGGQDGALGLELFLAGLKETANEGGMFGYFHKDGRRIFQIEYLNSIKAYQLQEENWALRQHFFWGGVGSGSARQRDSAQTTSARKNSGEQGSPVIIGDKCSPGGSGPSGNQGRQRR